MVTIKLLGEAGRRFGRQFKLAVQSPAEAIRALSMQIPEFRQYLLESSDNGINWRVVTEDALGLDAEQLEWPCSKRLVLAPQPAGRGAVGKIILGVALVAFSILVPAIGATGAPWLFGMTNFTSIGILGGGLIFSGVAQLLTPTPKVTTSQGNTEEQRNSYTFDKSNINSVQGDVVPLLYGERIVGTLPVLSFGITLQNSL
jgi:predicted phage tail protein